MNIGTASSYFSLERGVRQGDPLYPYLFIVVVETLAIAIGQNQGIRGISIENEETKISVQYADDTTAVLSDISSAEQLFELLDFFKDISGLKINCKKTEGMWIGSTKENEALGVYYTYDVKLLREKNFIERLDSIKKLINIWS